MHLKIFCGVRQKAYFHWLILAMFLKVKMLLSNVDTYSFKEHELNVDKTVFGVSGKWIMNKWKKEEKDDMEKWMNKWMNSD